MTDAAATPGRGDAYPASYYAATAHPAPPRPPLDGEAAADVCIVGAGFSGLSAGLELAERGYAVRVLEGARVGWGASGRNGGQIVNGLNAGLDRIEARFACSGNCAPSFSRVPQLGRLGDGVCFAHGPGGHGVVGSHPFGRILGEAVDGDLSRFDVFAKVPCMPFPGGRSLRVTYAAMGAACAPGCLNDESTGETTCNGR